MYEYGKGGLPIDREKAVELYRMSANEHNPAAEANLGRMYERGQGGLERNLREAEKWYKRAALHGSKFGQYYLAYLYEYGGEEVHDHQKALDWFRMSASQVIFKHNKCSVISLERYIMMKMVTKEQSSSFMSQN